MRTQAAMRKASLALILAVPVLGAGCNGGSLERSSATVATPISTETVVVDVVRRLSPSVVGIRSGAGEGSGVIIDSEGIILTNAHVVGRSQSVQVALASGEEVTGTVVGLAQTVDIAVVDIPGRGLPAAPLGDSDELEVGQAAIAIGNPVGFERTVTTGVLSAINRSLGFGYEELLQTDAAINPGNSGGPLLDSTGRVIGINTAAIRELPQTGPIVGLGFAIPINLARDIADQLVNYGVVRRALLGIRHREIDPAIADQFSLPVSSGIIVLAVGADTPAAAAGVRPGDIIVRIDDAEISDGGDLRRVLRERSAGDMVEIEIVRPEGRTTVRARLEEAVG
ncbi:MAG TPA: trypsin-like peptidase domain-containing protein [Longimicrobiales bacterium]|nr:trypsin-like peptidase domain-containing protein [Longimicrobiales bacterium]